MPLIIERFDPEGKPEERFRFLFDTLSADKLGKKPGDPFMLDERSYVVIEVRKEVEDERFTTPIDIILVQKKADQ